jgi:hypothetical protein
MNLKNVLLATGRFIVTMIAVAVPRAGVALVAAL